MIHFVYGKTYAVDRNRPFDRDITRHFTRRFKHQNTVITRRLHTHHRAHAIDVSADQMTTQPVSQAQRTFQIHPCTSGKPGAAAQGFLRHICGESRAGNIYRGQTHAVDRDAFADLPIGQIQISGSHADAHTTFSLRHGCDAANRRNNTCEHYTGPTLARMRISAPI